MRVGPFGMIRRIESKKKFRRWNGLKKEKKKKEGCIYVDSISLHETTMGLSVDCQRLQMTASSGRSVLLRTTS